jgi:hypothetical protein
MNLIENNATEIAFEDLALGDIFTEPYENTLFMKVPSVFDKEECGNNAIILVNGFTCYFEPDEKVVRVHVNAKWN